MTTGEMSTVVSSDVRRNTVVNLKQVNELPLRNALESFDKNGDGWIDLHELQKIIYWYGLWKYASFGLCLVIMLLVWSTFGLTIWAINLTKDYTVTGGVMTGAEEVVKMSVANTYIPLSWASLLDRRHLDSLDSLTIEVAQGNGNFAAGIYHVKVASYVHANSTFIKLFGDDGSRVWVNSGTVVLHHPDANEAVMVCGAAACNTLAVDVKPEYLQQLVQRSAALFQSNRDFELPSSVDDVAISKAAGEGVTCMAGKLFGHDIDLTFKYHGKANWDWGKQTSSQQRDGPLTGSGTPQEVNKRMFHMGNNERINTLQDASLNGNDAGFNNQANKPEITVLAMPEESQNGADEPDFGPDSDYLSASPMDSYPADFEGGEGVPTDFGPGPGFPIGVQKAPSQIDSSQPVYLYEQAGDFVTDAEDVPLFNIDISGGSLGADDSTGHISAFPPENIGEYQGEFGTYRINLAPAEGSQQKAVFDKGYKTAKHAKKNTQDLSVRLGGEVSHHLRESFFNGIVMPDDVRMEDFLIGGFR